MNQQQGDELVAAMAKETGLNPVRCAEHVALSNASLHHQRVVARSTWTLAAWRAANADETMAVFGAQAEAVSGIPLDERSKSARAQMEALAAVPAPGAGPQPFPFFSARDSVRAVMADGKARNFDEIKQSIEVAFAALLHREGLTGNQIRAVVSALEDFVEHGEMASQRISGQQTMWCWRTQPALELPAKAVVVDEDDGFLRDRMAHEATFRYFNANPHLPRNLLSVEPYRDGYRDGWNAARENDKREVRS